MIFSKPFLVYINIADEIIPMNIVAVPEIGTGILRKIINGKEIKVIITSIRKTILLIHSA